MNQIPKPYIMTQKIQIISPIKTLTMQTLSKNSFSDIHALNPKNYTNYIMQNIFKKYIGKKLGTNELLKLLNYKYLMTKNINLNFQKQSNKFCKKPNEKICLLPLCDLFKLILFHSL
jgi:hypothetical protein